MNTEQLKQLKPGDEILIRSKFKAILGDGDVLFSSSFTNGYGEVVQEDYYTHPSNIILPPAAPKYDPCRPFKKGDKVKPREEMQGRKISQFVTSLSLGKVYTVVNDEFNCTVDVEGDDGLCICSFLHLELVTPVEELEPYSVGESTDYFSVDKGEEELCLYWKDKHPHPKASAEAECARLNEEYRKEVCNG